MSIGENELNNSGQQANQKLTGLFVAVSGPSGVGKGTVVKMLKKSFQDALFPKSQTTREMRPGEKSGEVYDFISRDLFEQQIAEGKFLEYAQVHQKEYYGTLKAAVEAALGEGKLVIKEVDRQGMYQIKQLLPKENLLTVFIKPRNLDVLLARIAKRGKLPEEEVARRLKSAQVEMDDASNYDFQVINEEGEVENCFEEVSKIIVDRYSRK